MIACENGRCRIDGPLTIDNVTAVLAESERLFDASPLEVDLAGVTDVDSSAVSLLLQWERLAKRHGGTVSFRNIPPNLKSLATLYGVADLIPGIA
jgi:phospholipid transport system transporter-binding protein